MVSNNRADFLLKSVEELKSDVLQSKFSSSNFSLLAGCAPCQTFSAYNSTASKNDKRWWLLEHFARLVTDIEPDFVTMENVPRLRNRDVFFQFLDSLERAHYYTEFKVVNCQDYGVPQRRNRLVLIASKFGPIQLITPTEFGASKTTVRDSILSLPPIEAGESFPDDSLHRSAILSKLNMKRIEVSKQGGTWKDWPKKLIAHCHTKESGQTFRSVYGRMSWDEPSPTITTQFSGFGNGRFGHPEQNRAISLREGAILQSFPNDYKFTLPGTPVLKTVLSRLIGNAVPPTLGKVIGLSILRQVETRKIRNLASFRTSTYTKKFIDTL